MAGMKNGEPSRPDPDPTVLTTAALLREIESLKELMQAKLDAIKSDVVRIEHVAAGMPEERKSDILHLRELLLEKFETSLEKFRSIQTQFVERDTRTEQTAKDSKVAV